jgi:hypothetical protein
MHLLGIQRYRLFPILDGFVLFQSFRETFEFVCGRKSERKFAVETTVRTLHKWILIRFMSFILILFILRVLSD